MSDSLAFQPPPSSLSGPDSHPYLSVLIVEDNDDAASSTAELLEMRGHTVRIARSGLEGLSEAESDPPDVVLLDIGLPGLNGWEVCRQLKQSSGKRPVVVAVTGYDSDEDCERSKEVGIDLHLTKPVEPKALASLLDRFRC
jgi:two-component system, OmpR family, response regulator